MIGIDEVINIFVVSCEELFLVFLGIFGLKMLESLLGFNV